MRTAVVQLALASLVALAACSYTFDDDVPTLTAVGAPVDLAGTQSIDVTSLADVGFVAGSDGTQWIAVVLGRGAIGVNEMRFVRLGVPPNEVGLLADEMSLGPDAAYLVNGPVNGLGGWSVTVARLGMDTSPPRSLSVKPGKLFVPHTDEPALAWFSPEGVHVLTGQSLENDITLAGAAAGEGVLFDAAPTDLVAIGTGNALSGYRFADDTSWQIPRPDGIVPRLAVDGRHGRIGICDSKGLFRVAVTGGALEMLDGGVCVPASTATHPARGTVGCSACTLQLLDGTAVYWQGNTLRAAPLDGSTPPRTLLDATGYPHLLDASARAAAWRSTPDGTYIWDASDGWIGSWQFMERGLGARFSRDGTRVRWIEHAADLSGSGDLRSAPVDGGAAVRLAYNATEFDELDDGRVLVAANQQAFSPDTGLFLVDDQARVMKRFVAGALAFLVIPGGREVLAAFPGDQGLKLRRVAIPPR